MRITLLPRRGLQPIARATLQIASLLIVMLYSISIPANTAHAANISGFNTALIADLDDDHDDETSDRDNRLKQSLERWGYETEVVKSGAQRRLLNLFREATIKSAKRPDSRMIFILKGRQLEIDGKRYVLFSRSGAERTKKLPTDGVSEDEVNSFLADFESRSLLFICLCEASGVHLPSEAALDKGAIVPKNPRYIRSTLTLKKSSTEGDRNRLIDGIYEYIGSKTEASPSGTGLALALRGRFQDPDAILYTRLQSSALTQEDFLFDTGPAQAEVESRPELYSSTIEIAVRQQPRHDAKIDFVVKPTYPVVLVSKIGREGWVKVEVRGIGAGYAFNPVLVKYVALVVDKAKQEAGLVRLETGSDQDASVLVEGARLLVREGLLEEAVELAQELRPIADEVRAFSEIGEVLASKGESANARRVFEHAIELGQRKFTDFPAVLRGEEKEGSYSSISSEIVSSLLKANLLQEAAALAEKIESDVYHDAAMSDIIGVYAKKGDLESAQRLLARFKRSDYKAAALSHIARRNAADGNVAEAKVLFTEALRQIQPLLKEPLTGAISYELARRGILNDMLQAKLHEEVKSQLSGGYGSIEASNIGNLIAWDADVKGNDDKLTGQTGNIWRSDNATVIASGVLEYVTRQVPGRFGDSRLIKILLDVSAQHRLVEHDAQSQVEWLLNCKEVGQRLGGEEWAVAEFLGTFTSMFDSTSRLGKRVSLEAKSLATVAKYLRKEKKAIQILQEREQSLLRAGAPPDTRDSGLADLASGFAILSSDQDAQEAVEHIKDRKTRAAARLALAGDLLICGEETCIK